MQNFKDTCIQFLSNDETKKEIVNFLKPITESIYNELYIYIWIICFVSAIQFLIILANLFLLLKIFHRTDIFSTQFFI